MQPEIDFVGVRRCRLGESPVWDPELRALFWVDAVGETVVRHDLASGEERAYAAPDVVGSIVLGATGSLVAGVKDRICRLDLASGRFDALIHLDDQPSEVRLNDGKTDRQGRYVTGSMGPPYGSQAPGRLYRFDRGGEVAVLRSGIVVSNAICFSPKGERLYFADSVQRTICAYDYDPDTGAAGPPVVLIDTAPLNSFPDGATVDAAGDIWVALTQTDEIARFAPDGRLKDRIALPIPMPSCPAFGGPDLDVLFVTSISDSGLQFRTDHPDGGRTLAIRGLGVRGLPETRCRL
jgi:L-arabinonolactonase